MNRSTRSAIIAAAVAGALALSACGGGGAAEEEGGLTADGLIDFLDFGGFGGGSQPSENYNPYSPTGLAGKGYFYEPLFVTNKYTCEPEPWLATEYTWPDPQTLVVTIREGVKWSDGEAFDADDVAFTFNMLKEFPALDLTGALVFVGDVTADSPTQVTFSFTEPGAASFIPISDTLIVPEHIWSQEADPVVFTSPEGIGTGPFVVGQFNPQQLTIVRNQDYWQADKVKVQEIRFHAPGEPQVEQLKLARGEYDTNSMFVPDIDKAFVEKDPEHNHYWFPPGSPISLYMNLTIEPFDDVEFRRAVAYAIDKQRIIDQAQFGYVLPASQTTLVVPAQEALVPTDVPDGGILAYDVDEAISLLEDAGYTTDADGRRLMPDGTPMQFSFKIPGGYTDWIQAGEVIQDNFEALGITLDVETPTSEQYDQQRKIGEFELMYGVRGGTCNMFRNFQEPLSSAQSAPIGEEALTNEVRWEDPATDELIDQLRVVTDDAQRDEIVGELAKIAYEQVPYVPMWYGGTWFEYQTDKAVGWPNADDPYAYPNDILLVITNLEPAPGLGAAE